VALSGEPVARQTLVTRAARPPTDGIDAEDALYRALRTELGARAAPGRAREKNAGEERVKEVAEVGAGKEIREEEGRGKATEGRPDRGDWCLCLFLSVFVFIKCIIYPSIVPIIKILIFKFL
jgi:hypothetical protein